ncbi:MAG: class I SAM-dependent methyltransferase [Bryobacterales bacterium]|nr:class I SAM-dependent methyltransferase [Bryobacterales bacterium]
MKQFQDYDPFAWLYANYWGGTFHKAARVPLRRLLTSQLPAHAQVLDLCCGDGRLAALLVRSGFRVTGVDGSEKMLAFARQRCPEARFLLADARSLDLPPRFHAAVSSFDSLNHIMTARDLGRVFCSVWRLLRPGGLFVFDLNREEAYRNSWVKTGSIVTADVVSVSRGVFLAEQRLAVCDITLMRRNNGCWERSDFRLRQRLHPRATVLGKLAEVGFEACVHDAAELGMKGEIGQGRDFYEARKPLRRLAGAI